MKWYLIGYVAVLGILNCSFSAVIANEAAVFSGEGDLYDLGAVYSDGKLTVFLANKMTNEPEADKKVEFVPHGEGDEIALPAVSPGIYEGPVSSATELEGQISVNYEMPGEDAIELSQPGHEGHDHGDEGHDHDHAHAGDSESSHGAWPFHGAGNFLVAASALLVFVLGWFFGSLRSRRSMAVVFFLVSFCGLNFSPLGRAGPGHDHAEVGISSGGEGTTIRLTKKSQFLIGLRTQPVKEERVLGAFRTFGHTVPKPQLDARIRAPRAGVLKGIPDDIWGRSVKRNEVIAKVDAVGLVNIRSPIGGTVIEATGVSGARVEASEEIMRVVDTSRLWIDAEVFQRDLSRVRQSGKAFVTLETTTALLKREARLVGAQAVVDEETMAGKVFLEIDNSDQQFTLGNTVQVLFQIDEEASVGMVLPFTAVLNRGAESLVYIKTGPDTFEPRPVRSKPGADPGTVTILEGLAAGDRVVVSGNYQLLVGAK